MKRILLILLLFTITGCGQVSNNKTAVEGNRQKEVVAQIDHLEVKLNSNGAFKRLTFKYPHDATTMNVGTYYMMDYLDNGNFVFRIAMYCFENRTLDETMKDTTSTFKGTKTINDRIWHIYEGKTNDNKNLLNYAYQYNNDTYTITFIFDNNLDEFINVFMNNVRF